MKKPVEAEPDQATLQKDAADAIGVIRVQAMVTELEQQNNFLRARSATKAAENAELLARLKAAQEEIKQLTAQLAQKTVTEAPRRKAA